jgi:hypothetical protein
MWQDPNAKLRKWQRETGTSVWGYGKVIHNYTGIRPIFRDPEKQTNTPIQRWQQFTEEDEVEARSSSTLMKGGEVIEEGEDSVGITRTM